MQHLLPLTHLPTCCACRTCCPVHTCLPAMHAQVIGECLEAVSSELTFFTLPNCFELFGFDLLGG